MNNNPAPGISDLLRHSLIAGGLAAAASFLWLLLEYAFGFHGDRLGSWQYMKMVALAFPIAAISLGIMRWRDRTLGGRIKFAQAFGVGLGIGLFFAFGNALGNWLYAEMINPGFVDTLLDFQARTMIDAGTAEEEVRTAIDAAREHATAGSYAFAVFVQMLLASLIIALFAAVVVRRRS